MSTTTEHPSFQGKVVAEVAVLPLRETSWP